MKFICGPILCVDFAGFLLAVGRKWRTRPRKFDAKSRADPDLVTFDWDLEEE
jgi:hypothetical protein